MKIHFSSYWPNFARWAKPKILRAEPSRKTSEPSWIWAELSSDPTLLGREKEKLEDIDVIAFRQQTKKSTRNAIKFASIPAKTNVYAQSSVKLERCINVWQEKKILYRMHPFYQILKGNIQWLLRQEGLDRRGLVGRPVRFLRPKGKKLLFTYFFVYMG